MTLHLVGRYTQRDRIVDGEHRVLQSICAQRALDRELQPRIRWWRLKRLLLRIFWGGLR